MPNVQTMWCSFKPVSGPGKHHLWFEVGHFTGQVHQILGNFELPNMAPLVFTAVFHGESCTDRHPWSGLKFKYNLQKLFDRWFCVYHYRSLNLTNRDYIAIYLYPKLQYEYILGVDGYHIMTMTMTRHLLPKQYKDSCLAIWVQAIS